MPPCRRYELYQVCDKAYGSEVDGRWTGVVGEVVEGRAHLGLANLGANYGRSHAIAFPRISTSYGGAGEARGGALRSIFFYRVFVLINVCISSLSQHSGQYSIP